MANLKIVLTPNAPAPIGPYSQAIDTGSFIFISGQIPLDPITGNIAGNTIQEQTELALNNLKAILAFQSLSVQNLVKATIFIKSMADFPIINSIYEKALDGWKPARSVVEVSCLPKNVMIEIEAIAWR